MPCMSAFGAPIDRRQLPVCTCLSNDPAALALGEVYYIAALIALVSNRRQRPTNYDIDVLEGLRAKLGAVAPYWQEYNAIHVGDPGLTGANESDLARISEVGLYRFHGHLYKKTRRVREVAWPGATHGHGRIAATSGLPPMYVGSLDASLDRRQLPVCRAVVKRPRSVPRRWANVYYIAALGLAINGGSGQRSAFCVSTLEGLRGKLGAVGPSPSVLRHSRAAIRDPRARTNPLALPAYRWPIPISPTPTYKKTRLVRAGMVVAVSSRNRQRSRTARACCFVALPDAIPGRSVVRLRERRHDRPFSVPRR